ncbi:NADPH-dependent assimilatory sulfite reductase hemoprotein subunit [Botrimarina hoheduenensis]|uniref:Sulfite reductase [ferredoxin] n=1 Tax=Botrimarina hoheduenensis TaxID=2528000 RepID=A0A5C5WEI2_9BACT|nr:NADPH-dependent assimilatory sulfite reductase hemoprotein subunit [Botrimarina hoheduenensis]TWT48479.1 Sulfite reductase [ferredoxin] [Botrimarina hoheduenensis]
MNDRTDTDAPELTPVEGFKAASTYLRGPIPAELANDEPNFSGESIQLLKHHGTYEQDDRDRRKEAKEAGVPGGKYYSMMVRTVIPGGKLTSAQLLAELDLCDDVGNTTLRFTTRQGIQLHGILKGDLKRYIAAVNAVQLTTLAACGDVARNMMCSPIPKKDAVYDAMQQLAADLKEHFKPQTGAYHELWITDSATGEKTRAGGGPTLRTSGIKDGDAIEPIYGATYLPRKFKMGVGLPGDNAADLYSQDIGFLAITEGSGQEERVVGYNLLVGGGFGRTPSAAKTFAAVAQPLCYCPAGEEIAAAEAVMKVQRDFGDRTDRKTARLKYLVHNWGLEKFKAKVEEYAGRDLAAPLPVLVNEHNDGMGWHEQGDGRWYYGLNVENGRVKDEGTFRLKSALREIGTTLAPELRITPHQGVIFCDIEPQDRTKLEAILKAHGVPLTEEVSIARRWSMACPAMPTCGLAITESERALPGILDQLDTVLAELGLQDEPFTTRMTGCPNGCARPYNSDIGLVGRAKEKYTLFLGGSRLGHRLNWIYKDMVLADEVAATLGRVFAHFKAERQPNEPFGDFCDRVGKDALLAACEA